VVGDQNGSPDERVGESEGSVPSDLVAAVDRYLARRPAVPDELLADLRAIDDLPTQREHD
jgi:hypothetical protein